MVRLKSNKDGLELFECSNLTVETTLSPNLAKNVVDGGRLITTSTILSPPLVVPQEGLSREMIQSPPFAAVALEANCGTAGWITVGSLICRALGGSLGEFRSRSSAETVGSSTLVEGTEFPVVPRSRAASAGPLHCANQQLKVVEE